MLIHWIWLSSLQGVSLAQKSKLLEYFRDPEEIYRAYPEAFACVEGITPKAVEALSQKDLTCAKGILRSCEEKNISILTCNDGAYPNRLKNIYDPPIVLYFKGVLPDWDNRPVIAVVGTRKATPYGMQIAQNLGNQMADCGALVISGGAAGIDTAALQGALRSGKKVVAVLGCGADIAYPASNRELFESISHQGCLLTEFAPGTPPNSWNFPQRNRIISGLSCGVVVAEAPLKSGAMVTAQYALDQGRDVFVVPGNVGIPSCEGSNTLLRQHAIAVFSGWDVLSEYAHLYPDTVCYRQSARQEEVQAAQTPVYPQTEPVLPEKADKKVIDNPEKSQYSVEENERVSLTEEEKAVLQCITQEPIVVDLVIAKAQLPAGKVLSVLTMLAIKGWVQNHPGKCVSLK